MASIAGASQLSIDGVMVRLWGKMSMMGECHLNRRSNTRSNLACGKTRWRCR